MPTTDPKKRRLLFAAIAWAGFFVWVGTVWWLSSRTGPEIGGMMPFDMWDKALHFIAFFCGAAALAGALRWSTDFSWKKTVLVSIAVVSIYGGVDEIHQNYTPRRTGTDVWDWTADTLGAAAAALLAARIWRASWDLR